jgi:O-antigen/teichoic acid export membrane protein
MEDEILYQQGAVVVSKTLTRIGSVSYPINGIGSVLVASPQRRGLLSGSMVCILVGVSMYAGDSSDASHESSVSGVAGALLLLAVVLAIAAYMRPYRLRLRTASGDQNVLESRNRSYLEEIKAAIEQAVARRG